jgi:hypothetical protein
MHRWLLGSAVLSGCLSEAPAALEGELGFVVQDALLVPCRTASGEQMMFALIRSPEGCQDTPPRRRTCEGMTSLLSYPFACQTGAIPMTLTAQDAALIWIGDIQDLHSLSTATVTSIERRGCGGTPQPIIAEATLHSQRADSVVLALASEELSGSVSLTVCR